MLFLQQGFVLIALFENKKKYMRLKRDFFFFYSRNKCCCGFVSLKDMFKTDIVCYMSHISKLGENNRKGKFGHTQNVMRQQKQRSE